MCNVRLMFKVQNFAQRSKKTSQTNSSPQFYGFSLFFFLCFFTPTILIRHYGKTKSFKAGRLIKIQTKPIEKPCRFHKMTHDSLLKDKQGPSMLSRPLTDNCSIPKILHFILISKLSLSCQYP